MELNSRRKLWGTLVAATSVSGLSYLLTFHKSFLSWVTSWFRWSPTTARYLEEAETKILSCLSKSPELSFISIPNLDQTKEDCQIRTLIMKNESDKNESIPLVLLHGFASGIGLWILNLEKFSKHRTVYALDLLGFGRSSRPHFSKDHEVVEHQFIESIEQWRKQINLDRFILLGHSMGGFLAAAYAIKYPQRVEHLILADPWGFPELDLSVKKIEIPFWIKIIAAMLKPFNPLAGLRAAGPWGPRLVQRFRPDIMGKFEHIVEDPSVISDYIYHCNAQTPSGEAAFKAMTAHFGWAKRPMVKRMTELKQNVSVSFIYGARSWVDSSSGYQVASLRQNSPVEIKVIQGAGHHVYADRGDEFNKLVCDICNKVENGHYTLLSFKPETSVQSTDDEEIEIPDIQNTPQSPVTL